jgi:tetratricopeptide (TPR) repeat protein
MLPDHDDESERLRAHLYQMAEEQFRRQMRQASILLSAGKAKDAIPLLERCYELHPDDVNVLTNLGGAYILIDRHPRAVPLLEKATELAPDNPNVWTNLAAAYLGKLVTSTRDRQDRALRAYRRVIELDAAYPNVHYNIGLIYVDRRDWQAAHDAFSRAIETNPRDEDARRMQRRVVEILNSPADPRKN